MNNTKILHEEIGNKIRGKQNGRVKRVAIELVEQSNFLFFKKTKVQKRYFLNVRNFETKPAEQGDAAWERLLKTSPLLTVTILGDNLYQVEEVWPNTRSYSYQINTEVEEFRKKSIRRKRSMSAFDTD